MNKKRMASLIEHALHLKNPDITEIKRTPEGMTNDSYYITVNREKYVVRIPGKGTDELVDRQAEMNNLMYGTELGINPKLVYFNEESGVKITRKLKSAEAMTPELARKGKNLKKIIEMLKKLHHAEQPMNNRFDLFNLMKHYEGLVAEVHPFMLDKVSHLTENISSLKKIYETMEVIETPCHIDVVPANILLDKKKKLFLIDWEYSGMFDPMWDIATLFQRLYFTEEEETFFLKMYLEREPTADELKRILLQEIFQDYLWGLWTIYKEAKGDNYGALAMERMERAMENIDKYHRTYSENIVV